MVRTIGLEWPHSAGFRPLIWSGKKNVPTGETGGAEGTRTLGKRSLKQIETAQLNSYTFSLSPARRRAMRDAVPLAAGPRSAPRRRNRA
jgi:hypothetical protein